MSLSNASLPAQVYQMIKPPPPVFPGANLLQPLGDELAVDNFDGFSPVENESSEIRPWHAVQIPIGSWGDPNVWTQQQLGSTTIERFRESFVQKVELTGGFIHRNRDSDLGYSWASAAITLVVPLDSSNDNLILLTPSYRTDWLDGPDFVDVPGQVQSRSVIIGLRQVFNSRWSLIAGIQPGFFTDDDSESDGFRLSGLAMLNYKVIPDVLTVSGGIVFTGRNDVPVLPGFGFTWIPNPNTRFDINFPKPKISRRIGHIPFVLEDWVYLHGSFGGGEWAVQRVSGVDDVLTIRDFRFGVGYERILNGGTGYNVELGYVFARRLEFESGLEVPLDDSFLIEMGLRF